MAAMRGWNNVTEADVRRLGAHVRLPQVKRSKYGAVKTSVDGITFESAKEARRYQELLNLTKAGHVRGLRVQPNYTLCALVIENADLRDVNAGMVSIRRCPVAIYIADFEYEEHTDQSMTGWRKVVEDVKSAPTRRKEVYRLKKKLFEAQYGIQIREV
jgi:hypothetical protein